METHTAPTTKRKPGPKRSMGDDVRRGGFAMPAYLWDWAMAHPEGASELMRRLLQKEYDRQQKRQAPGS